MTDSALAALTAASTLDGTELVYGTQGGADRKLTTAQIKALTRSDLLPVANGGTGTATPGIVGGTNVTVSGAWPNQTINATGGGGSIAPLVVESANVVAQRNGAASQTSYIYGTDDWNGSIRTNYSRLKIVQGLGGGATLLTEAGGSGVAGSMGLGGATVDLNSYRPAGDFNGKISFNYYQNGTTASPGTWDVRNNGGTAMQFWANGSFGFNFDGGGVRTTGMIGFTNSAANGFTTAIKETSVGVVEINNGTAGVYRDLTARNVRTAATTVAALVAAATAGAGARAFVTDATAPTWGSTVTGGGAVATPVYSDGTTWKVG